MINTLAAMTLFALITSISPGPVNILATNSGYFFGFRHTLPYIIGATCGFNSILLVVGITMLELSHLNNEYFNYISYIGIAFLLFMVYKIAFTPLNKNNSIKHIKPPKLSDGLLFQWCNPKAWLVAISAIATFSHNQSIDNTLIALFTIIFFIVCFLSISIWVVLGNYIQGFLNKPEHHRYFRYLIAAMLLSTIFMLL